MAIISALQLMAFVGIFMVGAAMESGAGGGVEDGDTIPDFSLPSDYIFLKGNISGKTMGPVIDSLSKRVLEPATEENKEITIRIDSFGGSVYTGYEILGLMDHAKSLGYTFTCYVDRKAMSMAFIIFASCDRRLSGLYSLLLFHPVRTYYMGPLTAKTAREIATDLEILTHRVDTFLMERLGLDKKTYTYHNERETLWKTSALKDISPDFLEIVHLK